MYILRAFISYFLAIAALNQSENVHITCCNLACVFVQILVPAEAHCRAHHQPQGGVLAAAHLLPRLPIGCSWRGGRCVLCQLWQEALPAQPLPLLQTKLPGRRYCATKPNSKLSLSSPSISCIMSVSRFTGNKSPCPFSPTDSKGGKGQRPSFTARWG